MVNSVKPPDRAQATYNFELFKSKAEAAEAARTLLETARFRILLLEESPTRRDKADALTGSVVHIRPDQELSKVSHDYESIRRDLRDFLRSIAKDLKSRPSRELALRDSR